MTSDRLELYAVMAVYCGFTPEQVDSLTGEQARAILALIEKRNRQE